MKDAEKIKRMSKRGKLLRTVKILTCLLLITMAVAGITIYRDYKERPGILRKMWISERGADYITVEWERPRNVHKYVITYNDEVIEVSGRKKSVRITGLTENTNYKISVRADSKEREGFEALEEQTKTRKSQTIEGETEQIRFANRPVDLEQTAATEVTYTPGKGYSVTEDGKVIFTSAGTVTVTAQAAETEEYAGASREIHVEVLDTVSTAASGAKQHIFYKLNTGNCKRIRTVKGTKDVVKPQAFIYHDGAYLVTYTSSVDDDQRIIRFGDSRKVYKPGVDLGHSNGLTIAGGKCYSVRAADNACITFDFPNQNYNSFLLAYNASGIAYDEVKNMFYTSSRKRLVTYDSGFRFVKTTGRVSRETKFYAQDCAAYDGILMQAISGPGYLGVNYIDFYDMEKDTYLGSIECKLGEVESIIVDDEGYIEVLCNVVGVKDNIWRTPINMKMLCS